MSKTLRTLAAAAVMALGLPQMASAAPVTAELSFTGLTTDPVTSPAGYYNDSDHGFTTFSGGGVLVRPGHVGGADSDVLFNPDGGTTTFSFTVGNMFEGTFTYWVQRQPGQAGKLSFVPVAGSVGISGNPLGNLDDTIVNTGDGWEFHSVDLWQGEWAGAKFTTVLFEGQAGGYLFDDISFLTDNGRTTNVPEPGTVALVALALAGAASATRRRKA